MEPTAHTTDISTAPTSIPCADMIAASTQAVMVYGILTLASCTVCLYNHPLTTTWWSLMVEIKNQWSPNA